MGVRPPTITASTRPRPESGVLSLVSKPELHLFIMVSLFRESIDDPGGSTALNIFFRVKCNLYNSVKLINVQSM